MNQLKAWGFSAQWWRGERGEYWVIAQIILFIGFVLLPVYPVIDLGSMSPMWKYTDWVFTGIFGLMAALFLILGSLKLGKNLT